MENPWFPVSKNDLHMVDVSTVYSKGVSLRFQTRQPEDPKFSIVLIMTFHGVLVTMALYGGFPNWAYPSMDGL